MEHLLAAVLALGNSGAIRPEFPSEPLAVIPAEEVLPLKGFLSVWGQDCGAQGCSLPAPSVKNDPVSLALPLPAVPGEFRAAHVLREYPAGGGTLRVKAYVFALCPRGAAGEDCAGRYFIVQVELSGTVAAFCNASLNQRDVSPFPVLVCAAPKGAARVGVTLHREALP